MQYAHIIRAVFGRPWAILPETYHAMLEVLQLRAAGDRLTREQIEERLAAAAMTAGPRVTGGQASSIAVIPVFGVLSRRQNLMSETSGGTSTEHLAAAFRDAIASPDVQSVALLMDSPGGEVDGIPELAAQIRAARGQKPIVAIADTLSASAAYWLASQADEIVATPSSRVGSIGVLSAYTDEAGAEEQMGLRTEIISAGKYKAEATGYGPLSDEARAFRQDQVDKVYGMFVSEVAKGRGVPAADVRSGYGEGRALLAKDALAAGLVDRVDTVENTLSRMARMPARQPAAAALERLAANLDPTARIGLDSIIASGAFREGVTWRSAADDVLAGPIKSHKSATSDGSWDGPANEARLPSEEGPLRSAHAWVDSAGDPNAKASYRFIHHEVSGDGSVGAANMTACSSGIGVLNGGRGGTTIPDGDRSGVHAHLASHMEDGGMDAPGMKSEADRRAFAYELEHRRRRGFLPHA